MLIGAFARNLSGRARFEGGNSTLRLLNYPTPPKGLDIIDELPDERHRDMPLVAGRHTDAAGVSLLWQRQPGLQAQAPDGLWRDVPRLDNCISIHLGDVLEIGPCEQGQNRAAPVSNGL